MELPDLVGAIKFRMNSVGLKAKDLEPMIGRPNRPYEILNRRPPLTIAMTRKLPRRAGNSGGKLDPANECCPDGLIQAERVLYPVRNLWRSGFRGGVGRGAMSLTANRKPRDLGHCPRNLLSPLNSELHILPPEFCGPHLCWAQPYRLGEYHESIRTLDAGADGANTGA